MLPIVKVEYILFLSESNVLGVVLPESVLNLAINHCLPASVLIARLF